MPFRSKTFVPSFDWRNFALVGLDDGTMLVVYTRNLGGLEERFAQVINTDGMPKTAPLPIASGGSMLKIGGMTATKLSDGRIAVAWYSDETGHSQFLVRYQILNANGTAASSVFTVGDLTLRTPDPVITALADGGFAISYEQSSGLKTAKITATGAVTQNIELNAGIAGKPDAASLQNGGDVTVAAVESATGGFDVTMYIRQPTGEMTTKILGHTIGVDSPAVTTLKNGNVLVAWSEINSGGNVLKGRIFDGSGMPVGEDLIFARANDGDYVGNPDVEALPMAGLLLPSPNTTAAFSSLSF